MQYNNVPHAHGLLLCTCNRGFIRCPVCVRRRRENQGEFALYTEEVRYLRRFVPLMQPQCKHSGPPWAVPLLPAWKLANSMQWVLCWEDLEVTGPTATWVRETLQNTHSTDYLRRQSAGLFRSQTGPSR
jgi:hypothetical protein